MAALTGRGIAQTGTTMFRPPATPVAIGAFAGSASWAPIPPDPTHAGS